jgi:hypothetical protein
MNISGTLVLLVGATVLALLVMVLDKRYSGRPFLVERWAKENGYRIVQSEFCPFSKGPFAWKTSRRGWEVYHIRVQDQQDQERSCWLRCLDVGIFNDEKTEVVWETEV